MTGAPLKQAVSVWGIVGLGAGTAIGVSIFSILAPGTAVAGTGILVTILVAIVPMTVFAVVYAFMGSAVPVSGASYEWSRRFIHPSVGFLIGWLRIAGSTAALVLYAYVLVQYWSTYLVLPAKLTMFAVFAVFYVLNLVGVSAAARGQILMVVVLIVTCGTLVVSAVPAADAGQFQPFLSNGWSGVFAAVPLMVSLFMGIETATEVGEEVRDGRRNIPLGIGIAIVLTAVIYLVVAAACLAVLGADALAESEAPLLDVAARTLGTYGAPLIMVSATVAIGTSLNAISLILSRSLFAMGRSGILPVALARVHPRFGTPHVATTVTFLLCMAGLSLPSNLIFLFLAVNIPTLLKYGATSVAAIRVVTRQDGVYEQAQLKLRRSVLLAWAGTGVACAVGIIALGFESDWRPYAVLGSWALAGLIVYGWRMRGHGHQAP